MKLISYGSPGCEQPGVLVSESEILPLTPLFTNLGLTTIDMNGVLGLLPYVRARIEDAIRSEAGRIPVNGLRLGPPVPRPNKIVVVGGNYMDHVEEARSVTMGVPPSEPLLVLKPHTNVVGPYDPIVRPRGTSTLDYEGELGVVVGKAGKHVSRDRAWDYVAGYMCSQDMGDRDTMRGDVELSPLYMQPTKGKGFDTFCPTGPWLVTADEAPSPAEMRLQTFVNGELRQDTSVDKMIVDVPGIIEWLSATMTISPGDILVSGTPAGCGGMMDPPVYLQPGDTVTVKITGLGALENPIRDET
jgi:2-keto-4-pentenoate hydratase/2-oxohepta-3-ene-1,7-dioic acid hydratase in catechol pathway